VVDDYRPEASGTEAAYDDALRLNAGLRAREELEGELVLGLVDVGAGGAALGREVAEEDRGVPIGPDGKNIDAARAFASGHFDVDGNPLGESEWEARRDEWLPSQADRDYVKSLMKPCHEPGKIAGWIAPPARGINGNPFDFEYVRL